MPTQLGDELRGRRQLKGLSLRAVSEPADISTTYLQKLENGEVRGPSPNVLHRLAGVLELSYAALMELAGYVVPTLDGKQHDSFDNALASSDLTTDERKAVAAFVAHLRQQRTGDER